jgi:hypothetical protein
MACAKSAAPTGHIMHSAAPTRTGHRSKGAAPTRHSMHILRSANTTRHSTKGAAPTGHITHILRSANTTIQNTKSAAPTKHSTRQRHSSAILPFFWSPSAKIPPSFFKPNVKALRLRAVYRGNNFAEGATTKSHQITWQSK